MQAQCLQRPEVALDLLELDFQACELSNVGAVSEAWVLLKSRTCS